MGRGGNNLLYGQLAAPAAISRKEYNKFIDQLTDRHFANNQLQSNSNWLTKTKKIRDLYFFLSQQDLNETDFKQAEVRRMYQLFVKNMKESFPSDRILVDINQLVFADKNKLRKASENLLKSWDSYQRLFPELLKIKDSLDQPEQKQITDLINKASKKLPLYLSNIKQVERAEALLDVIYNQYAVIPQIYTLLSPNTKQTKQVNHYLIKSSKTQNSLTRLCSPGIVYDHDKWEVSGKGKQLERDANPNSFIKELPLCDKCLLKKEENKYELRKHYISRSVFHILIAKQVQPYIKERLNSNNPQPLADLVGKAKEDWLVDKLVSNLPEQEKIIKQNREQMFLKQNLARLDLGIEIETLYNKLDFQLNDF